MEIQGLNTKKNSRLLKPKTEFRFTSEGDLTKNNTEILKTLNLNYYFFQNLPFKKLSLHKIENIMLFY